jgi:hypothetical protein
MKAQRALLLAAAFSGLGPSSVHGDCTPTASLFNTYWKLVVPEGAAAAPRVREPHVVLRHLKNEGAPPRLHGHDGCTHIEGRWHVEGERVAFELQPVAADSACAGITQSLQSAARWRIDGERLVLFDTAGAVVARAEALYLR